MSAQDCTNPFNIQNHSVNNNYPLKRVSLLIQSHASHIGFDLEIGQRICDKCRLFARNKYFQATRNQKTKTRAPKRFNRYGSKAKTKTKTKPPQKYTLPATDPNDLKYQMPAYDSSDQNDSNEPYSRHYRHQQQDTEEIEYVEYSDDDDHAGSNAKEEEEEEESSINDTSNSVHHSLATPNPITEFKIVNVTSLPAEKHNEIMNNDDNAMNAMDSLYSHHDTHQLKISEIISTAPNSNVFGIAKKAEQPNSLLTIAASKPYHAIAHKSLKKPNSKIQKMKQQLQNNYRLSGAAVPNFDEISSTSGTGKISTDSDEHSNSNINSKVNRRKNTLTPLDCEMEFVEVNPPHLKKQAHMTAEQRLLSSQLETVKSIKNPNSDLMKKVAFLRVCVNYMMTELEGEKFNFGKNITFDNLKMKYNSKRMP